MGSFHCIPESCGRVVYREYLPPSVRWKYPDEDWQEIIGADDYALEQINRPQMGKSYYLRASCQAEMWTHGNFGEIYNGIVYPSIDTSSSGQTIDGAVSSELFEIYGQCPSNRFNTNCDIGRRDIGARVTDAVDSKLFKATLWTQAPFTGGSVSFAKSNYLKFGTIAEEQFEYIATDGSTSYACRLIVSKSGKILHQETRDVCPEVEKLDCRLGNEQQIQIEKTPYLSGIEVLSFARDAVRLRSNPFPTPTIRGIPAECLNIYRAELFDLLPSGAPDDPDEPVFGDFIAQICSAPGCLPPEYEVICNCNEYECPPGTCGILCNGTVCCYDGEGQAVHSFDYGNFLDQFLPGNRREAGA